MKRFIISIFVGLSCVSATAAPPYSIEWQKPLGILIGDGVATDAAGNVFVTGHAICCRSEAYLSKFDSTGTELWNRQLGTSDFDGSNAVAVDADGNAYITGFTAGSLGACKRRRPGCVPVKIR